MRTARFNQRLFTLLSVIFSLSLSFAAMAESKTLLNVSYDPTREFYRDFNLAFTQYYKAKTGIDMIIRQSHGGAGTQARAVIDGLPADVVTLALSYDIDAIAQKTGFIRSDWQQQLPADSSPYTSTIVFLVRRGNPRNIQDWPDLIKPGVEVITPNPKTSGGARWNYLAAYGYALQHSGQDDKQAQAYIAELLRHVPVLDSGARGATNTFVRNGIGDVLLAWENEALMATHALSAADEFEVVVPSLSILAQPPVAMVNAHAIQHGVAVEAQAYLEFLYSPVAQSLAARHFFRPVYAQFAEPADLALFPSLNLFSVDEMFGGWQQAQKKHFADGGVFDQLYQAAKP